MAEKKAHKIVSAETGKEVKPAKKPASTAAKKPAPETGSATGLRIGAIILWILAIVFEVLAVLIVVGKIQMTFLPMLWQLIVMIVLDLACVIIGAQLWKKANHIDPASESNKLKFWLWNNMGVIVCVFAFVPIIIIMLSNKNLDKKTKTICTIAAIVALLIGGATSIDYNPVSEEQKDAAVEVLGDTQVFWAPFGHVYHTSEDCSALNQSEKLYYGTVDEAIAHNRTRLCSFCARRDSISGVVTDDGTALDLEDAADAVQEQIDEEIEAAVEEAEAAAAELAEAAEDAAADLEDDLEDALDQEAAD